MSSLHREGASISQASITGLVYTWASLQKGGYWLHLIDGQAHRSIWPAQVHITSKWVWSQSVTHPAYYADYLFFLPIFRRMHLYSHKTDFLRGGGSGLWTDYGCKWTEGCKKFFEKCLHYWNKELLKRTLIKMSILLMYMRKPVFEMMYHKWAHPFFKLSDLNFTLDF